MKYADIKYPDIQDGIGIRLSIYVSGCHFHCKECHNKIAWNPDYGTEFTDETIKYIMKKFSENREYNEGLSLLGGEPLEMYNQEGLYRLTKRFREEFPEKNIWCWTGYDFDRDIIHKMYVENEITRKLLDNIDIMVDGQFVEEKNMIDLIARGSYNQRKIDVKESIKKGETVYLTFGDESRYENIKAILVENKIEDDAQVSEEKIESTKVIPISKYLSSDLELKGQITFDNLDEEKISAKPKDIK